MLPKMLSPKTLASKPDVVARVQRMMASTSVAGVVGDLLGMKVRADSTSLLAKIQVPTLVICGADDALIPPGESEAMHAAIKNSRLVRVPEAGHLVSLEQPDLFNAAVREFL
jgi:pimeloyl-ACP methyl ester carboxylesterase